MNFIMSTKTSSNNCIKRLTRQHKVVSKYFVEGKSGMDDSAEFQQPKKSYKGPKTGQTTAAAKGKSKRNTKKTKGQKDIRVALKSKKNELIAYSEDFEKVCKTSGIDLDCEQLQLAIALSKSLQEADNEQSQCSVPSTSQQRVRNIRTTLQEYGFQVPEVKIVKKRSKKIRKNSKLLLITNEERKQIIADRYAQVLIRDIKCCININENSNKIDYTIFPLYHITLNTAYELLRNDSAFYVPNLIEVSRNKIGSLLKDWSKIPGRPKSPIQTRPTEVRFWDMQYTQEELDTILSGSIERAQEVVNCKMDSLKTRFLEDPDLLEVTEITTDNNQDRNIQRILVKRVNNSRCGSPDLFDDDISEMDNTRERKNVDKTLSQSSSQDDLEIGRITSNVTSNKSIDFMDLTKCVNDLSQPTTSRIKYIEPVLINSGNDNTSNPQPPDHIDITRRKSNDFMEMTNCVKAIMQHKYAEINENIYLTQNSDDNETENTIIVDDSNVPARIIIENMDLTQSSNSDDDTLPFVKIGGKKIDASFPLAENNSTTSHVDIVIDDDAIIIPEDIRQRCVVPDTFEKINHAKERISKSSEESTVFEEYSFVHSDQDNKNAENREFDISNVANVSVVVNDIDLTQSSGTSDGIPRANNIQSIIQDNNSFGKNDDISIDYDEVLLNDNKTCFNLGRDINENNEKSIYNFSENIEGKQSIVIGDIDVLTNFSEIITKSTSNTSIIEEKPVTSNINILSNVNSEVFEISDEELNYSIHKSKLNNTQELFEYEPDLGNKNFELGVVSSLIENISNFEGNSISINALNTTAKDNILPEVEIKGTKVKVISPAKACTSKITPVKDNIKEKLAQTPSQKEYIIKTNQVTPMLDYESMLTPQRNEELEKYGLKPFKRKRAIKLLSHLYDQTHPVVENCTNEDLQSPAKRNKLNIESTTTPTKTKISPKSPKITKGNESLKHVKQKTLKKAKGKSPRKIDKEISEYGDDNIDIENGDYEETNYRPDIRDLDNGDTDWVFPKKEKAKAHSCRLPLHIAFHNYVASRSSLRDAILRYEPVNIDVIHKQLVGYGHRYDPKDLLRFLDKKCITVKTADKNTRNDKISRKKS